MYLPLSDLYLMKSSMPSLIIETAMTKTRGATAVAGFKGDMIEMDWMMAMMRK